MIEKITKGNIDKRVITDEELENISSKPLKFILLFVKKYFLINVFLIIAFVGIAQGLEIMSPLILGYIIDSIKADILTKEIFLSPTTMKYIFILLGLNIGWRLMYRLYDLIDYSTVPYIRMVVQKRMFEYAINHNPKYFYENSSGKIAQKVRQAALSSYFFVSTMLLDLTRATIVIGVSMFILAKTSMVLALMIIIFIVVFTTISFFLSRKNITLSKNYVEAVSITFGRVVDSLTNHDLVRSFAGQEIESTIVSRQLVDEKDMSLKLRIYLIKVRTFQVIATGIFIMSICYISALMALHNEITLGQFATNFLISMTIVVHIQTMSEKLSEVFENYGSLMDSITSVLKKRDLIYVEEKDFKELDNDIAIEFKNVSFGYTNDEKKRVLKGLNLKVKKNEKVGLVGLSGSGKSTIIRLIKRQFDISSGSIAINGIDIKGIPAKKLTTLISEVPQNPMLFNRSLKSNIFYGSEKYLKYADIPWLDLPEYIKSEIFKAAKEAHCVEFIKNKDNGFDGLVGENGIRLSGGEKQRIAIARAFMKNSNILLLDEATSSLDSESETHIQDALFNLINNKTVIAIAHRLSTITKMDRIIVLENGVIIQEGTHQELIMSEGKYKTLWELQSEAVHEVDD